MLGQLFELLYDVVGRMWSYWTLPVFTWMTQQLFFWLKGVNVPRLTSRKMFPQDSEMMQIACIDTQRKYFIFSQVQPNSWNLFTMNSSVCYKKHYNPWFPFNTHKDYTEVQGYITEKDMMDFQHIDLQYCPKKMLTGTGSLELPASELLLSKTCFDNNLIDFNQKMLCQPVQSCMPTSCCEIDYQDNMGPFKTYQDCKEVCKPLFDKTLSTGLCFPDKTSSSVASIDSGFQSFHSFEPGYKVLEENGVKLFVTDCFYNREGKLIRMSIGFDAFDELSSESSFGDESDAETDDDDDDVNHDDSDFIVFDTRSWCPVPANSCPKIDITITSFTIQLPPESPNAWEKKIKAELNPSESVQTGILDEIQTKTLSSEETNSLDLQNISNIGQEVPIFQNSPINMKVRDNPDKICKTTSNSCKKRVQFKESCDVHHMIAWNYAYRAARKGDWKQRATDREHFKHRIEQAEAVLKPVLLKKLKMLQASN